MVQVARAGNRGLSVFILASSPTRPPSWVYSGDTPEPPAGNLVFNILNQRNVV